MSQTFDPANPERSGPEQVNPEQATTAHGAAAHEQAYPHGYPAPAAADHDGGGWYAGGPGYGEPPMPPRRNHKRGLIITGAVALAAGAAFGGFIGSMGHTAVGTVTATSKTALSSSQIAARV